MRVAEVDLQLVVEPAQRAWGIWARYGRGAGEIQGGRSAAGGRTGAACLGVIPSYAVVLALLGVRVGGRTQRSMPGGQKEGEN